MTSDSSYHFIPALASPGQPGPPPLNWPAAPEAVYSKTADGPIIIERNVRVKLRDGGEIVVDIFRPISEDPSPAIIAWTPYGKHQSGNLIFAASPGTGVTAGMVSDLATLEGPDPAFWVPHGYTVINAEKRGAWRSPGDSTFVSPEESEDYYDLIEWAAEQSWCSGRVGLSGVSYLSVAQWRVAALNPPHLAAINPWEGWTDTYREVARHGGIPETHFWMETLPGSWGTGDGQVEDIRRETLEHPLLDDFWKSKSADLEKVTVPAFVVAGWADSGLHLRGTLEGYRRILSQDKWLLVHGRRKWEHYYTLENMLLLKKFFDHFLKGEQNDMPSHPRVQVEIREQHSVGELRLDMSWPLSGTRYKKLYLNADHRSLDAAPGERSSVSYSALASGAGLHRAEFAIEFSEATTLLGHVKLHLEVSTSEGDDLDLFVGLYKLDAEGDVVQFPFFTVFNDGPLSLGWLRASHRALDPSLSRDYHPVLLHECEEKVQPNEIVSLDVEVLPTSVKFEAGERLKLIIQGTDLHKYPKLLSPISSRHEDSANAGTHTVYSGGTDASYLLVPVIDS